MGKITVYALACPTTKSVRYIGVTRRSSAKRLAEHRSHAAIKHPALGEWLAELAALFLAPLVIDLEVDPADGLDAEARWITTFRKAGASLFNLADGGIGTRGCHHTEEWKQANSARMTGRVLSDETRRKIGESKRGKPRADVVARNKKSARLTDEAVAEIRRRLANGEKGASIAAEFGVSTAMVSFIRLNKRRS